MDDTSQDDVLNQSVPITCWGRGHLTPFQNSKCVPSRRSWPGPGAPAMGEHLNLLVPVGAPLDSTGA